MVREKDTANSGKRLASHFDFCSHRRARNSIDYLNSQISIDSRTTCDEVALR